LTVVNQSGDAIAGSRCFVGATQVLNGDSITLPVTDDATQATIFGDASGGWSVQVLPGIMGLTGNDIARVPPPFEHTAATPVQSFEWVVVSGPLSVVESNEQVVTDASIQQNPVLGTIASGDSVTCLSPTMSSTRRSSVTTVRVTRTSTSRSSRADRFTGRSRSASSTVA